MASSRLLTLIQITMFVTCGLVTGTEQHWKWFKPFSLDGSPKHLHSSAYKPKLPPPKPLLYSPHHEKPYSPAHGKPYSPAHENPYSPVHEKPFKQDHCELRKVIFTQDAESPQYLVYKSKMPDLKEFTLCHWHNIFNYTHDHPIFSYSLPGKSRVIYSWIENSPKKTYYSLAINGHTIYRINYPEKLFKWYHVCQSWNGHTGEWQLWINSERAGRGFYNLMVGKKIKGGGVAISGREYLEQGLAILHPAYSGELTLVTLYKAALTAGKAYNDHKHHHAHNFHHGYDESVDEADTEEQPALPTEAPPTLPPHLAHGGPFMNGQLVPRLPVEASIVKTNKDPMVPPQGELPPLFDGGLFDFYEPFRNIGAETGGEGIDDTSFRVNLLDRSDSADYRNKRNSTTAVAKSSDRPKRWTPMLDQPRSAELQVRSSELEAGSLHGHKLDPAQWEVMKVASVCAACEADPFGAAAVLSWQDTRKQFFNGALYLPALPRCFLF